MCPLVVILGFGNIKFWTALLIFTAVAIICTENSPQRRIVKFDEVFSFAFTGVVLCSSYRLEWASVRNLFHVASFVDMTLMLSSYFVSELSYPMIRDTFSYISVLLHCEFL